VRRFELGVVCCILGVLYAILVPYVHTVQCWTARYSFLALWQEIRLEFSPHPKNGTWIVSLGRFGDWVMSAVSSCHG
jgi:hypothetical protein